MNPFCETGPRGCGDSRTEDGVYLESGLQDGPSNIHHFYIDPPERVNMESLGIPKLGVSIKKDNFGIYHVLDWIGEKHYPSPVHFIDEVHRMGVSRKISPALDLSLLSPSSTFIFIHAKAAILNGAELTEAGVSWTCPVSAHVAIGAARTNHVTHNDNTPDCIGTLWAAGQKGNVVREFAPAAFMRVPITGCSLIARADGTHNTKRRERIEASLGPSGIPTRVVNR